MVFHFKNLFLPSLWTLEVAQFFMVGYYILGGAYSIQLGSNVRMDLFYANWSDRRKAAFDTATVFMLLFYLGVLLYGGLRKHDLFTGVWGTKPDSLAPLYLAHQDRYVPWHRLDAVAGSLGAFQGHSETQKRGCLMSYELIALLMFSSMMLLLLTGQRVFGAIGAVAAVSAVLLWGNGRGRHSLRLRHEADEMVPAPDTADVHIHGVCPLGVRIADDLYKMFHVWMGPINGGLAIGTIALMVLISAMNGLSVAGMAIGATIALPELLRRGYDKRMVTGVIQAGSSLGILVPPSVVLVLYAMIARQPVGQLWLAGILPGLMMAAFFILVHCHSLPH